MGVVSPRFDCCVFPGDLSNESINIENAHNFLLNDKVKLKPKDQQVEEMEIDTNNDLNSEHKECSDQIDLLQAIQ